MPQMGESITEGTITKWLKKVGDTVQRDEPIFEISTDKVDAEIPSPVAGVLSEIKVGKARRSRSTPSSPSSAAQLANPLPLLLQHRALLQLPQLPPQRCTPPAAARRGHIRSSPLVRKIAKDNNVDLAQVPGTGASGRVTKSDIVGHMEGRKARRRCACRTCRTAPAAAKPARPRPRPASSSP